MALSPHHTSMSAMSQDKLAELIIKSYVISDYVFQMLSETEESILCDCQRMAAAPNRAKGLSCKTTDCSSPVGSISQQLTLADRPNYPTAMAVIILEDPHRKHSVCVCLAEQRHLTFKWLKALRLRKLKGRHIHLFVVRHVAACIAVAHSWGVRFLSQLFLHAVHMSTGEILKLKSDQSVYLLGPRKLR